MTFELQRTPLVPEGTTVAQYVVNRLGTVPTVRCEFMETKREWSTVTISVVESEVGGLRDVTATGEWTVDMELFDEDYELAGIVTVVAGQVLTLSDCTITTPGTYYRKLFNTVGAHVYDYVPGAHAWTVELQDAGAMSTLMAGILVRILTAAFTLDAVEKTEQEVQDLAIAMLMQDQGVDTHITQAFEALEVARRLGQVPTARVIGNPA